MKTYPPGSLVLVVHENGQETEEVYPARTYYEGKYDEKGLRCERWGSEEADVRARELGIGCVRAFVPYPPSRNLVVSELWAKVLRDIRELRLIIVNNPKVV